VKRRALACGHGELVPLLVCRGTCLFRDAEPDLLSVLVEWAGDMVEFGKPGRGKLMHGSSACLSSDKQGQVVSQAHPGDEVHDVLASGAVEDTADCCIFRRLIIHTIKILGPGRRPLAHQDNAHVFVCHVKRMSVEDRISH
jgi:hypothetical protein